MAGVTTALLAAGSIALQYEGMQRQEEAAEAQQEALQQAQERREAQTKIQNAERRRRAVAQMLSTQAQAEAAAANQGAQGASGFEGASSAIASGTAANIGQQRHMEDLGFQANTFTQQAQEARAEGRADAQRFNALSGFAASASGMGTNAGEVLGNAAADFWSGFGSNSGSSGGSQSTGFSGRAVPNISPSNARGVV